MLTPEDIAKDLHIKKRTVLDKMRAGIIPASKIAGTWLAEETHYAAWKQQAFAPKAPAPTLSEPDLFAFSPRSRESETARKAAEARKKAPRS